MEGVEEEEEDSRDFAARSCARGTSRPCESCPTGTSRPCASCQYICPTGPAAPAADLPLLLSRRANADASGLEDTADAGSDAVAAVEPPEYSKGPLLLDPVANVCC